MKHECGSYPCAIAEKKTENERNKTNFMISFYEYSDSYLERLKHLFIDFQNFLIQFTLYLYGLHYKV